MRLDYPKIGFEIVSIKVSIDKGMAIGAVDDNLKNLAMIYGVEIQADFNDDTLIYSPGTDKEG